MTETLDVKSKQLADSLKKDGFNVFFAKNTLDSGDPNYFIGCVQGFNVFFAKNTLDSDNMTEVFWDENENSKHFFDIAKKEGIKTIVAEIKVLEKDMLDLDSEDEESLNQEILMPLKTELNKISKYAGKVGSYKFSWIKDGTKYSLMETTDWFKEFASIIKRLSTPIRQTGFASSRFEQEEIPKELKEKSEEDIAEEMIDFIKEQLPTLDRRGFYQVKELFWSKKGIMRFTTDPELRFKMSKVEMIADKSIEEAQAAEEKERLPDLIDSCIDWCKENELKKVTKTNIKAFLAEKEITLSRNSEDILYQRVNFKLKDL
jgi:hypothetical protein